MDKSSFSNSEFKNMKWITDKIQYHYNNRDENNNDAQLIIDNINQKNDISIEESDLFLNLIAKIWNINDCPENNSTINFRNESSPYLYIAAEVLGNDEIITIIILIAYLNSKNQYGINYLKYISKISQLIVSREIIKLKDDYQDNNNDDVTRAIICTFNEINSKIKKEDVHKEKNNIDIIYDFYLNHDTDIDKNDKQTITQEEKKDHICKAVKEIISSKSFLKINDNDKIKDFDAKAKPLLIIIEVNMLLNKNRGVPYLTSSLTIKDSHNPFYLEIEHIFPRNNGVFISNDKETNTDIKGKLGNLSLLERYINNNLSNINCVDNKIKQIDEVNKVLVKNQKKKIAFNYQNSNIEIIQKFIEQFQKYSNINYKDLSCKIINERTDLLSRELAKFILKIN